jgi:hypothetical protein
MDELRRFDSVIVGMCSNVPSFCYRLIELAINYKEKKPYGKITSIDDGFYRFCLIGKMNSKFTRFREIKKQEGGLVISIAPLIKFPGEIYSSEKEPILNQSIVPRTIFLNDGRVYLERALLHDSKFSMHLPEIMESATEFFNKPGLWSLNENNLKN